MILFTGIIEEVGTIKNIKRTNNRYQLNIEASKVLQNIKRGDSIAVNGVCLTVVNYNKNTFSADVMPETLRNTNLDRKGNNLTVNLEQPVTPDSFLSGHLVTGHIDGTGKINGIKKEGNARVVTVSYPAEINKYIVEKGSIALNGISLTIVSISKDYLTVSLIPETWQQTTFSFAAVGDKINIETDLIGKYVEKMLKGPPDRTGQNSSQEQTYDSGSDSKIDKSFLEEKGFM
ncbi:MAG: riboflavin synthase [Halanaerobiaceae bacterium]